MNKATLLVVDDESDNLDALERIFRKKYHFLRADSGVEALKILSSHPEIDVIITDQRMPQMTGVELLEQTLATHPHTVRILLTGYTEIDSIIAAVNQGHIFRYITKPWDSTDLINSVEQAVEHYARGRQLELKNAQLENALSELKLLDKAKDRFMILINHELKTPLTVINSFSGLLSETILTDDQKIYLDRITRSTNRLHEIIEDTLVLTQFNAGKLAPKKQPSSMNEMIQVCLNEYKEALHKKSLTISILNNEEGNSLYQVDPILMKKALNHLMGNAIRFSPHGSNIEIEFPSISKGLEVAIENEGNAIPDGVIANLERPFNLQEEIMNHSKGLGLGLSTSDAIVKAHNGQLKIQNKTDEKGRSRVRVSISLTS
jgi:K+-sensing histidine kinase KdpD